MIADYDGDITEIFKEHEEGDMMILATRNIVLFPGVITPILVGREKSRNLIDEIQEHPTNEFAVFCQKDAEVENPGMDNLYNIGVYAKLVRSIEMPDGKVTVILQGQARCTLKSLEFDRPYLHGIVADYPENPQPKDDEEFKASIDNLRTNISRYIKLNDEIPDETQFSITNITNNLIAVNFISSTMPFPIQSKIELLSESDLKMRVMRLLEFLSKELQLLKIKQDIRTRTQMEIDEQQKEYFLQQQIKNIK